ncbi:MAG TPA: MarR family winged helix-turn-helix transcriptional regulator [Candidatus Limnocylindrales bacterium]|nr:MarR family winged helix-turn-helix transcriptional regulator [Candidatus Limnocylindrales bacterium]
MEDDEFPDIWPAERRRNPRTDPSVCPSVHGAYHAMTRRLNAVMRDHGLDASEALVLAHLRSNPGVAAAVIRHALGFHRSTLSSILDRLEHEGLIMRPRSSWDGRRVEVDLTSAGRLQAAIVEVLIETVEEEIRIFTSKADRRGADSVYAAFVAISRPDGKLDL